MKKVWTVEEIKNLLETRVDMVVKSVVKIYEFQTETEKVSETTHLNNGVGFNGADAGILSSFAKQIQQGRNLSPKQFAIANKKIKKYAKQLTKIANGEISLD